MQQYFSNYVQSLGGSAVPTDQPFHEMARGMTKHLTMHPGEGWTTESANGSTTPEGWTMATRLSMMGSTWASNPTKVTEVLVTLPNSTGNATTDAQAAVNLAKLEMNPVEAQTAVAAGAGAWLGPDPGSLVVSIIFAHQ